MSIELGTFGELIVTSFFGGGRRGRCIQLTPISPYTKDYTELTRAEVEALVEALTAWLKQPDNHCQKCGQLHLFTDDVCKGVTP